LEFILKKNIAKVARNKGFGLVEIMLVLIIVALLGNYAYGRYTTNKESTKAEQEKADVVTTIANTQEKFTIYTDYATASLQVLIDNGVFPVSVTRANSVTNQYAGTVTVSQNTINSPADTLKFTTTNYTVSGCKLLIPKMESGMLQVSVNGQVVKPLNGTLDITKLGPACTAASSIEYIIAK
jgi:prepilin-type N-terminal cleavage/methylation domain-containing protein